jgi:hypothetical protein
MKYRIGILTALALCLSLNAHAQRNNQQSNIAASTVNCYFVGRAYLNTTGHGQVVGYFTHIKGIHGSLFNGSPSEATAYFTFRSDIFSLTPLLANGDIGLDFVSAGTFDIYYNANPNGDWSNPNTFSDGQLVARFYRDETLFLQIGPVSHHVLTETLLDSSNFRFDNQTYSFKQLTPDGFTLNQFVSTTSLPGTADFPFGLGFAGNGFAILRKE